MPRNFIDTTAPGVANDWLIYGTTNPGWEAVLRTGEDTTYIGSSVAAQKSTFYCSSISKPVGGSIMALTLHYRIRRSVSSVGGSVNLLIVQNGIERLVGTISPASNSWEDGEIRVREDWTTTQRFVTSDLFKMGVGAVVNVAPSAGGFEISKFWLEVEYIDGPYRYDPYWATFPDAVVGPLAWGTFGAQPVVFNSNYLEINDGSTVDTRFYVFIEPGAGNIKEGYTTKIETRSIVNILDPSPNCADALLIGCTDLNQVLMVHTFRDNNVQYVGFLENGKDAEDKSQYYAYAPFNYDGEDVHYKLKIRRYISEPQRGRAQLFINYDSTPIIDVSYSTILGPGLGDIWYIFGATNVNRMGQYKLDYFSWNLYKEGGGLTNQNWTSFTQDINNVVLDEGDPDINKLKYIALAGVTSGQSDYACKFDVADPTEECKISQLFADTDGAPINYDLDIDYKDDLGVGNSGEIILQRCSDLWYWDDTIKSWVSGFTSVALPNSASRVKLATALSGIINVTPEDMLLSIDRNSGAGAPYNLWLYKVNLYK